ncbi:NAD-dependent epimerase/dehydratase family protein [Devosia sp. ZW T5_3]|uniref:NAD-dependent epimerase/dehydratase family protein n=1 Tax=Devosia sp. ZW T5_3 TaxID=3378085 RepID=UPI003853F8B8
MHIFMTGPTGYIGAPLAQSLLDRGHSVTGLARSAEAADTLAARGLQAHQGDTAEPESISDILPQVDAVIHIAVGLPRGVTETDFAFTDKLIQGLAGTGKPLIMTSGLGVYAGIADAYVDETTPLAPAIEMQAMRVKLEDRVLAASAQDIRSIVLRPAHVYGQGGAGTLVRTLLGAAAESKKGAFIGDGIVPVSTVHVDDLVAAYIAALDRGRGGQLYNLVSDRVYMRDLAKAVSHATGGNGDTVSLTAQEAQSKWGPIAALYGASPIISGTRAIVELGWKATAPSALYELVHGSLRVNAA